MNHLSSVLAALTLYVYNIQCHNDDPTDSGTAL